MRHYRPMTPAQRDAVQERKAERMREAGIEPRPLIQRDPLELLLLVDGPRRDDVGRPLG